MSEVGAILLGALIGGIFGLLGVWLGFVLSRRNSEADRRAEKQFTLYLELESLASLLAAYQKQMISIDVFHPKWMRSTERAMTALFNSGVDRLWVLEAINGKWEKPESVAEIQRVADEILKALDPEYSRAVVELERKTGVKREDIDPVLLSREQEKRR
jgi:hypothetical protein